MQNVQDKAVEEPMTPVLPDVEPTKFEQRNNAIRDEV